MDIYTILKEIFPVTGKKIQFRNKIFQQTSSYQQYTKEYVLL